jgi:hypothetical protein
MASFPVICQNLEACAVRADGKRDRTSILPALGVLLVTRGSDRLIVPTPHSRDRERAEAGIAQLPAERRSLVSLCDINGDVFRRVKDYLEPLRRKARKWPEDAFVAFAQDFLYEVLLGTRKKSGILSNSASIVRDFIPILDSREFAGEERFRLAEVCRLVCSYEPMVVDHGDYIIDIRRDAAAGAWEILELAEFRALVAASGVIGYLKQPRVGLRRLRKRFRDLIARPAAAPLVKLASTAVDVAGASAIATVLTQSAGLAASLSDQQFHPPFLSLGPVQLPLYRATIAKGLPDSRPPDGTIMVFEAIRGGQVTHEWLNTGEEEKLELEAVEGFNSRVAKYHEARKSLDLLMRA